MEALELLQHRRSTPADQLDPPAPEGEDLDTILQAGVSAPDHDGLRPWHFLLIQGAARPRLGEVFAQALRQRDPDADAASLDKQRAKPQRAPLIVAVIACVDPDNARVPAIEQILSAGAALHRMQIAAQALGYGGVWLTGPSAHDGTVAEALGLDFDDRLVGFLYLGTPAPHAATAGPPRPAVSAHATTWSAPVAFDTW